MMLQTVVNWCLQEMIKYALIFNLIHDLLNLIIIFTVYLAGWKYQQNHHHTSMTRTIPVAGLCYCKKDEHCLVLGRITELALINIWQGYHSQHPLSHTKRGESQHSLHVRQVTVLGTLVYYVLTTACVCVRGVCSLWKWWKIHHSIQDHHTLHASQPLLWKDKKTLCFSRIKRSKSNWTHMEKQRY